MKRLLLIDNYDSFTFNLYHLFESCGVKVDVFRHDEISIQTMERLKPDYICISPGPKNPAHSGISKKAVETFMGRVPILGVCLGMQVINEVFGGKTVHAPLPVHGKKSTIRHLGCGIFRSIPSPFMAARYHSLCIKRHSDELVETAWSDESVIMAIEHREFPIYGVQFHPESFMTEYGKEMVMNFLEA